MSESKEFLGTQSIGKLLFQLAVPTVTAQLINMLYNIVDRIYIGHMPQTGTLALTGVGVCLPVLMIVSAFAALVSSGGAPRASIELGRGDKKKAEKILGNCFMLQVVLSIVITVILLIFNRSLLMMFGASENTIEYAVSYMNIYAIGTLFVQLTLGLNAFITAQGYAKTGMLTVLIGAICNIILDPIFIFVFEMGVAGAALATILSQAVSCVWVVIFLMSKKSDIRLRKENMRLAASIIVPCVTLGLATFIMQASESIITVCFNSSLQNVGGDIAVGAMTILSSVMQFAMLPMQGIAQGAQPISSYNFGARKPERVKATFKYLLMACATYSILLWAFIMLCPRLFASIFSPDVALLDFTEGALRTYCAMLFLMGVQIACQMTFVSIGNAKCSIIVAVVRKFVLLVPLIYIVPMFMSNKVMGIYMAEPVADAIAVTFTVCLFAKEFKKAMKELEAQ